MLYFETSPSLELFITELQKSIPSAHSLISPFIDSNKIYFILQAKQPDLIGFAVAELYSKNQTAQLRYFYIKEEHRQKGIGSTLFTHLQSALKAKGICALGFEYDIEESFAIPLEKILKKHHWQSPHIYLIRLYFNSLPLFNPPWLSHMRPLTAPFSTCNWKSLSQSTRQSVISHPRFPKLEIPIQEEVSLILKHQDRVIGWNLVHCKDAFTLSYSHLYINSLFRGSGASIALLAESIHLQKQSPIPKAIFETNLEEVEKSWKNFIKKRFFPYANKIQAMKWAFHFLVSGEELCALARQRGANPSYE